jgi:hypothetical protein
MPYYLVTHTSLVEADDEVAAAEKVSAEIRHGRETTFTVKFDDQNIKQVAISHRGEAVDESALPAGATQVDKNPPHLPVPLDVRPTSRETMVAEKSSSRPGISVPAALALVAFGIAITLAWDLLFR